MYISSKEAWHGQFFPDFIRKKVGQVPSLWVTKQHFLRQGVVSMQPTWSKQRMSRLAQRFWNKVKRGSSNICWEWTGAKTPGGYGVISPTPIGKGPCLAHRVSWFLKYGVDPGKNCVCHRCDNPGCVNPAHLFLGSRRDNAVDCTKKGRRKSVLTEERVKDLRMLYATGRYTMVELAEFYGIAQPTVSVIIAGKSWKRLLQRRDV